MREAINTKVFNIYNKNITLGHVNSLNNKYLCPLDVDFKCYYFEFSDVVLIEYSILPKTSLNPSVFEKLKQTFSEFNNTHKLYMNYYYDEAIEECCKFVTKMINFYKNKLIELSANNELVFEEQK